MTFDVTNKVPYLKTSRIYSENIKQLIQEINVSYVDISGAVNDRTIGLFPINKPAIGGENWYIEGQRRQQNLRQVYPFTAAGNVQHNLNLDSVSYFTKCQGSFTDGTNWYGAIYGSNTAIAGQISFYITSTNIVVLSGAGAPTITDGLIVLEWITHSP